MRLGQLVSRVHAARTFTTCTSRHRTKSWRQSLSQTVDEHLDAQPNQCHAPRTSRPAFRPWFSRPRLSLTTCATEPFRLLHVFRVAPALTIVPCAPAPCPLGDRMSHQLGCLADVALAVHEFHSRVVQQISPNALQCLHAPQWSCHRPAQDSCRELNVWPSNARKFTVTASLLYFAAILVFACFPSAWLTIRSSNPHNRLSPQGPKLHELSCHSLTSRRACRGTRNHRPNEGS